MTKNNQSAKAMEGQKISKNVCINAEGNSCPIVNVEVHIAEPFSAYSKQIEAAAEVMVRSCYIILTEKI